LESYELQPLRQDVPIEVDNPNDAIDEEQPIGGNNVFHAKNEVEEVSSATDNAKKRAPAVLDKSPK
jgi:hypothetical protein